MTDKRSESAHPPLPSIAPPTEDIDSEWAADEIPAPARAPQMAAPATTATPALATPILANPLAPSTATPVMANPLRKQTLLGIAPVAVRSEPPAAATLDSEPPRHNAASSGPPRAAQPVSSQRAANNPLRKQTLVGIAPVVVSQRSQPIDTAQAAAADRVASDAPVTRDAGVRSSAPKSATAPRVASTASDEELPQLRTRLPRWILPVGFAATVGLGVIGLRNLDRAPTPLDAELGRAIRHAPPAAAIQRAAGDDTDTDADPRTPAEPDPLPVKAGTEKAAAERAAANRAAADKTTADEAAGSKAAATKIPGEKPAASESSQTGEALDAAEAAQSASGEMKRVNIDSEPPGARLYWRGKEIGTTPFALEIPSGERRSYELDRPGFVTRRVVIDGSKSDITIGLKPESDGPAGVVP